MARVRIAVTETTVHVIDVGDVPPALLRETLEKGGGTFDGNWSPHDIAGEHTYKVDLITVEEEKGASRG